MAEVDGGRVAGVFAADAQLQIGAGGLAALNSELHEFADAGLVEAGEGVLVVDLLALVLVIEQAHVVAT